MSKEVAKPITVKKLPLIKNIILKKGIKPLNREIKLVQSMQSTFQEDVIFTSTPGDFTSGEVRSMRIVNRLDVLTKSSKTVAKCQSHTGEFYEKTSDEIAKLIGQNNYDILFTSLCSIISQELKIRSINSLLTIPKSTKTVSCQTETSVKSVCVKKNLVDSYCQTSESSCDYLMKITPRRRNKRQHLAPYVVKDTPDAKKPNKIVISPDKFNTLFKNQQTKTESQTTESSLPELGPVFDDDSNGSVGRFSALSVKTTPDLMVNPFNMLVDKHTRDLSTDVNQREINATEQYKLTNLDSPGVMSPCNDKLQHGMQELLHTIPPEKRMQVLLRQGVNEWKYCLTQDSEGHLPIHVAVLTSNLDLLRRQCLVLKMRDTSVDVPADGLTPLRMSLFQENTEITSILLHFGADPLDTDEEDRTPFHIAAEMSSDHLQILINYCQHNAKKVLQENEELWKPQYENKFEEELAPILLTHINKLCDSQGYTPLMLASKLGKYNNVMALVESCRQTINMKMPNSGNTALYLAVAAACMDAAERGNRTKVVDHFKKTVEILVENGADPNIVNFAGASLNDLLTEFNIGELSMLIANKMTSVRYFEGQLLPDGIKGTDFMLFKDKEGKVNIKEFKQVKQVKEPKVKSPKTLRKSSTNVSPMILENITYKPPVTVNNASGKPNNVTNVPVNTNLSTLPGNLQNQPAKVDNSAVNLDKTEGNVVKQENVNVTQTYTPIVKNFTLNKPLLIKKIETITNNKRKLEIVVEPSISKKSNKGD